MPRKKTTEEFIADARKVHGDRYDYSKAEYLGVHAKLCIICPKHGEFWQEVNNHLHGAGCPKCMSEANSERFRSSTEEFIKKARKVHGNKYDYSKVDYSHNEKDVCIICPEHGEFWQSPHNHLHGAGCPKCTNNYVPSTEEFISASKAIYGEKYDYSKVEYRGNKSKVCIICPEHGEFWTTPNNHLKNHGCPKCSGNYGIDLNYFLKKADERFHGKYDYSKVEWKGYQRKVCIICPEHGEFWQTPDRHLKSLGCPKCSGRYLDQDFFIEKSRLVHGDKYDYSKVIYSNSQTKVCIVCPKHGEFWIKPNGHLQGHGCRLCYNESASSRLTKSATDFLSIAQTVHKGKYDYSEIEYVNRRIPVKIICPKHGPFLQTPKAHIRGAGCPMCNNSLLEDTITSLLIRNNIPFIPQKTFDWLKYNGTLHLDFYLYEHNIVIECQGIQHFKPVDYFGGEPGYKENKKRDTIKKALCEKRGLRVIYFSNLGIHYPYEVIEDPEVLLKIINSVKTGVVPIWQPDPELPFNE